jgi:DNA-binding response OmpR family regulator
VTKPFGLLELLARVEALLRRAGGGVAGAPAVDRFGEVEIDRAARTVTRRGEPVSLAPREFDLLLALFDRNGGVISRQELLRELWGHRAAVLTRTVDIHVAELRRKLEDDPANPQHILTVWKKGYRLRR